MALTNETQISDPQRLQTKLLLKKFAGDLLFCSQIAIHK